MKVMMLLNLKLKISPSNRLKSSKHGMAHCTHKAPMAFVPLIIRWGPDTSSDRLRKSARCTRCGGKGAMLMHPSYVDRIVGFQPFPL
jgi:hypothetical protein